MPDLAKPASTAGGLGSDSRAAGLLFLRHGPETAGFDVTDLGNQNEFDHFAGVSESCDTALFSNIAAFAPPPAGERVRR